MIFCAPKPETRSRASVCKATLAVVGVVFATGSAWATKSPAFDQQLLRLDPTTRLEQTCDAEVMQRINHDETRFKADKVIAYTFAEPQLGEDSIKAPGAVFRSEGEWYRLKFFCRTGPRHLDAQDLRYKIGSKIPREDWQQRNLYE